MPEQPGLEVAYHHAQPSLEAWNGPNNHSHHDKEAVHSYDKEAVVQHHHYQTEYHVSAPPYLDAAAAPPQKMKKPASRRRLLWIIGTLVLLIVILAAVLGGVLGSKASKSGGPSAPAAEAGPNTGAGKGGDGGNQGGDSKNSTAISRPKTLRQGSSLSVTGWRNMDGNVEKYLVFQTPQDELRLMKSPGGGNDSWEAPVSFNAFPKPDTQLAVTTIVFGTAFKPQIEIFYTGKSSRLLGSAFNDESNPKFGDDSINSRQIVTGLNSSLASYWPWILAQDSDGTLLHVRDQLGDGSLMSPQSVWDVNRLNATAQAGSSLAIVPLSTNFNKMAVQGGYAAFYQALEGGTLKVEIPSLEQAQELFGENYTLSWRAEEIPSGIVLPKRASIAAFSVARDDAEQLVNTYVLYVDEAGDVNVLYTEMGSGTPIWTIVQPEVMRGVDKDGGLACLGMVGSPAGPSGGPILLDVGSEETMRCFFVRGGNVYEVKVTGQSDWSVVGVVPIP